MTGKEVSGLFLCHYPSPTLINIKEKKNCGCMLQEGNTVMWGGGGTTSQPEATQFLHLQLEVNKTCRLILKYKLYHSSGGLWKGAWYSNELIPVLVETCRQTHRPGLRAWWSKLLLWVVMVVERYLINLLKDATTWRGRRIPFHSQNLCFN